jgi:hypothetical protein
MPASDPRDRALIAQVAAHTRWSQTPDRTAATAPARKAALQRFERLVDPDGTLPPATRALLAENARKAYFIDLARKSAAVRRGGKPEPDDGGRTEYRDPTGDKAVRKVMHGGAR